ncbi:hypothetical protein GpartN1_g5879.t1 [Galdieria partita]|uniref:Uncharacterized protein n=1 Tax=Galdieria partita TaxID=83374 RepID=A0A9C7Q0T9_9RHOD|nr:hypothetical protein GpartN1_g5262.t1 [Galdieria partita]GJQ14088.1 hypothetical protein GpartN1_g5879.t1 [Galdieria partita]
MYELERTVFQELFRRVLDNQYQVTPEERKALVQCDNSIVRRGIFSALTSFSLIYYGLKHFQKYFNASSSVRLRPAIPATLLGLTTGFFYGRTAAPGCLQNLMNVPDSAVAEEVKIIMKELYEQSPSSSRGHTIATRYGFVLDSSTTQLNTPDIGFGDNENSDWKEVDTWQSDGSIGQSVARKRVGPRNPDKRRVEHGSLHTDNLDNHINKNVITKSATSLPNSETDDGFASLPGDSNSNSNSDVLDSGDIGNDSRQESTIHESSVKRESHRRRRRNEVRRSNGQVKPVESDPTEQGTIHADTKDLLSSNQDTDVLWGSSSSDGGSSATLF